MRSNCTLYRFEAMVGLGGRGGGVYTCGSYGLRGRSGCGSTSCSVGREAGPVAPTLGNGGLAVTAQVQKRRRAVPAAACEWRSSDDGRWSSERRWSSSSERQSSKRLVEEPGGNGGQAQWVGGGGYGGWV
jgi:hypothetical protein